MIRPDPEAVAAAIGEVSERELMARFGKLEPEEIREKSGPADLVTEADEAAERALRAALHDLAPAAAFVGEESAARDPAVMQAIARSDAVWIVDPLDGTRNFIRGIREFGVIVAFVERGVTTMGWIHAAPLGACAIAVRGEGARYDGAPFRVRPPGNGLPKGLRSLGWLEPDRQARIRAALAAGADTASAHCSAYAYLELAAGKVDFKLSSRVHPWDHAAGALILGEIGGEVAWLDDRRPYAPGPSADAPLLAIAPGRDWTAIASIALG